MNPQPLPSLRRRRTRWLLAGCILLGLSLAKPLAAAEVKIGAIATLEGAFAFLGTEAIRGVKLAIEEFGGEVAGKKVVLITASSNAQPDTAVAAARKLVEQDGVDLVVGPLSGSEGLAVKDYAKTQPQVSFMNGSSAAQDTTLRSPAENFFRWNPDGAQFVAGLGEYAYRNRKYRRVAIVAEDYSFPYTMVFGFMHDFCRLGGRVPAKFWVPIGTKDYSSVIASLPDDIDAVFVGLGGSDAVNFLSQYQQAGSEKPMVAGSITIDQSVLGSKGRRKSYLVGTPTAAPTADSNPSPAWQAFVKQYRRAFPDGLRFPSLFAQEYYVSTKATLVSLQQAKGDLSNGQRAFRQAMSQLRLQTPAGLRYLDENRQVVTDIFLTEVQETAERQLYTKLIKVVPAVNQTLGQPRAEFLKYGKVSRNNPDCP